MDHLKKSRTLGKPNHFVGLLFTALLGKIKIRGLAINLSVKQRRKLLS